jgi:hypothetical protein
VAKSMKIKVLVIGPSDIVNRVVEIGKGYSGLVLLAAPYKHEEETVDLASKYKTEVDILLFAGPIPYQIASKHFDNIPMVYIPYTGTTLYRVLFQMIRDIDSKVLNQQRISIDTLEKSEVQERIEELGIKLKKLFVKEYQLSQNTEEIIHFHYELWINQKIDCAITCITSVYEKLKELGVPCYRIIPTKFSIHDSLKMVLLEGKSLRASDTQLAISIVSIEDLVRDHKNSEYEIQRKRLELQQLIIDFGEKTQALIHWSDRNEITFVTTRGVIQKLTYNLTHFSLLNEIQTKLQLNVIQGIGIGYTANEAESKAREALLKAKSYGYGSCYAILPNGSVLGPLGKQFQLDYSMRSDDPERLILAKKAGLSIGTFNKLYSFNERYGSSGVTAGELAKWFGITLRSARRILSQLEQSSLAVVVGEEQPISKGRPRKLYTLKIGNEKN